MKLGLSSINLERVKKMKEIERFILHFAQEFDKLLIKLLPKNQYSSKLYNAMKYSINGKRLRPLFLIEIAKIFKVKNYGIRAAANRINSLLFIIHDDLLQWMTMI